MRRFLVAVSAVACIAAYAAVAAQVPSPVDAPPPSVLTRGVTHETWTGATPALTATSSLCAIADDPTYGSTPGNPIKVGGGAMSVWARSRQVLYALRGPAGEGLHLVRLGSFDGPDDTILDVYRVDYRDVVRYVYIDAYRWTPPKAPAGFVCGAGFDLDPPGSGRFAARGPLMTLAARLGDTTPAISLDDDGSATHGVVFDHVRLVGRAFAAAARSGHPMSLDQLPPELTRPHFVVVAYPLACAGGRAIAPQLLTVRDVNGESPPMLTAVRGDEIRALVPGFDAPAAAFAVEYEANLAIPGKVEITYEQDCETGTRTLALPFKDKDGHITRRIAGRAPAGVILPDGGAQVRVQVYFDFDGNPQFATYAGGPETLAAAAIATAAEFHADPPRINGAPVLQPWTFSIAFEK